MRALGLISSIILSMSPRSLFGPASSQPRVGHSVHRAAADLPQGVEGGIPMCGCASCGVTSMRSYFCGPPPDDEYLHSFALPLNGKFTLLPTFTLLASRSSLPLDPPPLPKRGVVLAV